MTKNNKNNIRTISLIAIMTAAMCILGPFSIPIGPVPISLTSLVIYLTAVILGFKKGTVSCIVYLLTGLLGMPVFSAFSGGAGKLLGPTGGYLIGFIFMAAISGLFVSKFPADKIRWFIGMTFGTIVTYCFGTAWLAFQTSMSFQKALFVGVIPFIAGDTLKMIIAIFLGSEIKNALIKANLL